MRHFTHAFAKMFLLSAAAAVLMAGFALADGEELAVGVGHTTGSGLRMREEPSTESGIVTQMDKDYVMAILGAEEGWYQVAFEGKQGYVSADFFEALDGEFETFGQLNAYDVNVRTEPNTSSDVAVVLEFGAVVTVNELDGSWYGITCEHGTTGYIRSDFLNLYHEKPSPISTAVEAVATAVSNAVASSKSSVSYSPRSDIASTALQYKGVPYVWGGASSSGFDCSGFSMYVYRMFGYSLPHTASGQWESGLGTRVRSIYDLQPGDLVFFNDPSRNAGKSCSHVGIYVGNGQVCHASSGKGRVVVSDLTSGYYNTYFRGGIHVG